MAWWHCCDVNRQQFAFRLLCSHVSTYPGCLLCTVCYKAGFSSLNLGMLLESVSSLLHILSDLCLIRHNPWLSTFRSTGQCGAGGAESVEPQRTEYSCFCVQCFSSGPSRSTRTPLPKPSLPNCHSHNPHSSNWLIHKLPQIVLHHFFSGLCTAVSWSNLFSASGFPW